MFTIKNPDTPTTYEALCKEAGRVSLWNRSALDRGCQYIAVKDDVVLAYMDILPAFMSGVDRLFWRDANENLWELVWDQATATKKAAGKARLAELEKKYADKS